jgi:CPA1 family monovalent cation:H+ antiporter
VWGILVFVLNAVLFMLVGLQLPSVIDGISRLSMGSILVDAAVVSAAVIVIRFLWVFPATYAPRLLSRRVREREPAVDWQFPAIVGWTGMRGAVSLAAALAIPQTIDGGGDFPQRDLIIFLTYAVILVTLILQGLTLPGLIKVLGVEDDGNLEQRESKARILAARAALDRIEELRAQDWVRDDTADRMRGIYDFRIRRFSARFDDEDDGAIDEQSYAYQRLRRKVLEAERAEIIRLRNVGKINDEIMRRLERDLDLEDTRLEV